MPPRRDHRGALQERTVGRVPHFWAAGPASPFPYPRREAHREQRRGWLGIFPEVATGRAGGYFWKVLGLAG